jgi:tryptophan synthase alpha chain
MGHAEFARGARAAGVDGVLVVDYPPEEGGPLVEILASHGIDSIFLLSPTTDEKRMAQVARLATGYIYYVSLKGVTGAANLDLQEVAARIPRIREHIRIPIGVGFGIRDGETARAIASISDAVVIGSRLVQEIESSPADKLIGNVSSLLGGIRRAMDAA